MTTPELKGVDPKSLSAEERASIAADRILHSHATLWKYIFSPAGEIFDMIRAAYLSGDEEARALFASSGSNSPGASGEPAAEAQPQEPAKVCPNCGDKVEHPWEHFPGGWRCPTLPAPPSPPRGEMPEAVYLAINALRQASQYWAQNGVRVAEGIFALRADALESWWREQAGEAQKQASCELRSQLPAKGEERKT